MPPLNYRIHLGSNVDKIINMKKFLLQIFMLSATAIFFSSLCEAQFVVRVRPVLPVISIRTASPSTRHVWVAGDYVYRGNNYVYNQGYWAVPPQPGFRWVEGHWKETRRGWRWIAGHWR